MTSLQTATEWPAGVIARYLTVGGATVDVAERSGYYNRTDPTETVSTCAGCGEKKLFDWNRWLYNYSENREVQEFDEGGQYCTPKAREWAQAHAEKCRAMSRPEGGAR